MAQRQRASSSGDRPQRSRAKLLVLLGIGAAALYFAVQGGEYGTLDLLDQRSRKQRLVREIDSLEQRVDSLREYHRRLQTDPALQERIAREEFGMVKGDRELLYRFAEPAPAQEEGP
ncbi:MAG TPA: septum formation initiator family protein [Gemmatimonadaceae bacterium]